MKRHWKKFISLMLVLAFIVGTIAVVPNNNNLTQASENNSNVKIEEVNKEKGKIAPKYIFLFIGDGMSYPQIQAASYYMGATTTNSITSKDLSFMDFPIAGSATTFDNTSFCPDSASTATSIATGHKTSSGTINMDTTFTTSYETITEKLKKQFGYKIGIISSVNINHATPAAFYAHQASRNNYYEIGMEMIESKFDYFAGGDLLKPTGNDKDKTNLYDLASQAGYKVIKTQKEAQKLTAKDGKAIVVAEKLADSGSMSYEIDATGAEWHLKDYVKKGIEVLNNDKGFFMMVEGGKIDWACHANDVASSVKDTIALSNAINEAIKFYNKHPKETLILVTGDHETGGLSIGFAGTNYETYLNNIKNQKISYAQFDALHVSSYKKNKTEFSAVLGDIQKYFGLIPQEIATSTTDKHLILTDYEYGKLYDAYQMTISEKKDRSQEEYELYGSYEPLTVTITHILNNKSGIDFTSYSHTGIPVPVFAIGNGATQFGGYYDNTDIYKHLAKLTKVK